MRFTIKLALCFIVGFFTAQNLSACCAGEYVGVYPREGSIAQNSIFLIEYAEHDFKLAAILPELEFYLQLDNGEEIQANLAEKLTSIGTISQLLLKPGQTMQIRDSVRIQVRWKNIGPQLENVMLNRFKERLNSLTWNVAFAADLQAPVWTGELEWKYTTYNASVSGHGIQFIYKIADNYQENFVFKPGTTDFLQLFEVEVEGKKVYCVGEYWRSIYLSSGTCGSNFPLMANMHYQASITPLDFSGNRAAETKTINVNTNQK